MIGSAVIHCRTRASLVWTRAAIARSMSRSVRMPMSRPKSLTTTAPVFWLRHALGDLAERVLGRDGEEVRLDDVRERAHGRRVYRGRSDNADNDRHKQMR